MKSIANIKLPILIDQKGKDWVQSVVENMTLDEKIGQLIHVATWSNKSEIHVKEIEEIINKFKIGGLIFFQGNPESQARLTNHYQTVTDIPLMISIDAEWGLGMRLESVESFPYQMTLGALERDDLIYEMGRAVGKQLKRIGANLNHGPVIDVNTNPKNPVIGFRSFGQDKYKVAQKGRVYMQGLQDEFILACAKHFPGHGDTSVDSHFDLPVLDKTKEELIEVEFFPFKELIKNGLGAIMTAHLQVPKIDNEGNGASTLSKVMIDSILKQELNFKGLVLTDALDMKAVSDYFDSGILEVKALSAGNDILLFVKDVEMAISTIKLALFNGEISEDEISEKCYKQLAYKYWMGLRDFKPINLERILEDVNMLTPSINEKIYAQSMTLLEKEEAFPTESSNTLLVSVFAKGDNPDEGSLNHHTILKDVLRDGEIPIFEKKMSEYLGQCTQISIHEDDMDENDKTDLMFLSTYDNVILSIHNVKLKAKDNFGFSSDMIKVISQIIIDGNTHLVFFGNAYALDRIADIESAKSILLAYQENAYTHKYAFEVLTNVLEPKGKLPVTINHNWTYGHSLNGIQK